MLPTVAETSVVPVGASGSTSWALSGSGHSATVNLVDQRNRNRLANHVGERVSITGMLSERDLDVQRLSRVANTCE